MTRKILCLLLCALLACLCLAACGRGGATPAAGSASTEKPAKNAPQVNFAHGSVSADTSELRMPLAAGETALLSQLPLLSAADFSGSADEAEIVAWVRAHPEVECYYTVTMPNGEVLDSGTRSYDMSGMSVAECEAAAEKLAMLPGLKNVKLGSEGGVQNWESLAQLRTLLPGVAFKYGFTLYGKECSLSDMSLNLSHIPVTDNGEALRKVMPLMSALNYVDMDTTGVSNQEMEKLRADFPDIKFVWRVWFGEHYSVRTDVQRILASKAAAGGPLTVSDVEALSCCHDVVFLDLGHNQQLTDISFVSQMRWQTARSLSIWRCSPQNVRICGLWRD